VSQKTDVARKFLADFTNEEHRIRHAFLTSHYMQDIEGVVVIAVPWVIDRGKKNLSLMDRSIKIIDRFFRAHKILDPLLFDRPVHAPNFTTFGEVVETNAHCRCGLKSARRAQG